MQETLYQTSDAGVSLLDRRCRRRSIRRVAEVSLSDNGCIKHSIQQHVQESLYQTSDAGLIRLIKGLLHSLSDRETPASAV